MRPPQTAPGHRGARRHSHTHIQAPLAALNLACNMQTVGGAANWTSIMRGSRSRKSSNRYSKNMVGMIIRLQRELNVQWDQVEVELEGQPLSWSYPNGDRLRQAVPEGSAAGSPSLPTPFLWKKGKRGL